MKHFFVLLVSATSLILSVSGTIPNYIHVCKRNDPDLTQCIKNSILNLRPQLISGLPDLGVPSVDPMQLPKLPLNLGQGFNAEGLNVVLTGARNFEISDMSVDIASNAYSFVVSIPDVRAVGTYNINAAIAGIPFIGSGPMELTARNVKGHGRLQGKLTSRGEKTYNWFPTMSLKFDVGDYKLELRNLFEGQPVVGTAVNRLLNEEKAEVLASMLPGLERSMIEQILLTANNICRHFTWDELFPNY